MSDDTPKLFYLQDARQYIGNDVLWWQDGGGYTCNIDCAEVMSREQAFHRHNSRETDVPWPKLYVDAKISRVVDMQNINCIDAVIFRNPPGGF